MTVCGGLVILNFILNFKFYFNNYDMYRVGPNYFRLVCDHLEVEDMCVEWECSFG